MMCKEIAACSRSMSVQQLISAKIETICCGVQTWVNLIDIQDIARAAFGMRGKGRLSMKRLVDEFLDFEEHT